jgi:hypothetical protein
MKQKSWQSSSKRRTDLAVVSITVKPPKLTLTDVGVRKLLAVGTHCCARKAIVVAKHHNASRSCANRVERKVAILTDSVIFEKKTGAR